MAGFALDALKEGFFGEYGSRLVLVEYEALARAPASPMEHLYAALHSIRRKADWIEHQSVLQPELFRRFDGDMFWRQPKANIRGATIIHVDG